MTNDAPSERNQLLQELEDLLAPPEPQITAPTALDSPAEPELGRPERVLIIDDNADYRKILEYIFTNRGFETYKAEDGTIGFTMAKEILPDIIVLDFNMPGKNGFEVIQDLRSDFETRKIPIVLFTGAPNRDNLRKMDLGAEAFLFKPASNQLVIETVENVLKKSEKTIKAKGGVPKHTPAFPPEPGAAAEVGDPEEFGKIILNKPILGDDPPPAPLPTSDQEPEQDEVLDSPGHDEPNLKNLEERFAEETTEDQLFDLVKDDEERSDVAELEYSANDSPLVNRVNRILMKAVDIGASDIHIEPGEGELIVRARRNGALERLTVLPGSLGARIAARIKIMSELTITERRQPQDGQFRISVRGEKIEFRVSTLPSAYGEKIVLRILGGGKVGGGLDDIGLSDRDLVAVDRAIHKPDGMILVTGPTGSGKTTTLYTMLREINKPDVNIMTAEDPVEYRLPGITQVPIKASIGFTFEKVLRAFLRQDPDIMLVGEIRDIETAEIAVKASITGHLVLSTLHTNSAPATIMRITHMGLAPYLVAASVKMVIAQRLVKVLCESCKIPNVISPEEGRLLRDEERQRLEKTFRGVGCKSCGQSGFSGRKPIFEIMPVDTLELRDLILKGAGQDQLAEMAISQGMIPLREAAMQAVIAGETSVTEALKIMLV